MIAIMMMIAIIISVAAHLERHRLEPKRIAQSLPTCQHDSVTSKAHSRSQPVADRTSLATARPDQPAGTDIGRML